MTIFTAVVIAVGACGERAASPVPPQPSRAESIAMSDLSAWIRFRLIYDLRADADWVMGVAANPTAMDGFGLPLLPSEVQQVLDAQAIADAMVEPARRYGSQYPLDYVGVWIEGSVVVLGFRDNLADRRAEVAALLGDKVEVRAARYTRLELQGFINAIDRERGPNGDGCDGLTSGPSTEPKSCREGEDWFRTIGVEVRQVAIDEMANVVWISYEAPTQGVEALIREHFEAGDWLRFRWDGPPS